LTVDASGNSYLTGMKSLQVRVARLDPRGRQTGLYSDDSEREPSAIAADACNRVFVSTIGPSGRDARLYQVTFDDR